MSYTDFLRKVLDDFHTEDEASRKNFCRIHLEKTCNECDSTWCQFHKKDEKREVN